MLKLTIGDLENARSVVRYGSDRELLVFVRDEYPVAAEAGTLTAAIEALNGSDLFDAKFEQYRESIEANILPSNYLTESQADEEDPWPRAGDRA
jgi:hypothetical protein